MKKRIWPIRFPDWQTLKKYTGLWPEMKWGYPPIFFRWYFLEMHPSFTRHIGRSVFFRVSKIGCQWSVSRKVFEWGHGVTDFTKCLSWTFFNSGNNIAVTFLGWSTGEHRLCFVSTHSKILRFLRSMQFTSFFLHSAIVTWGCVAPAWTRSTEV